MKHFVLSAANALVYAMKTGKVKATRDVLDQRIMTCKSCHLMIDNRCNSCGCYIVAKAGFASEKCPEGKW